MKTSSFSIKSVLVLLVSLLFINTSFSQDRKIYKALEYIQAQKFDYAEEVIKGLQKKNATFPATYYVQSMLYGSKAFKRYNIDSSFIFYNQAIEGLKSLEIKELTDICTDFKLCLSRSQIVKDSIADIAFNQYKTAKSIEKMKTFNSLYKGTASIQQSNELIENLYYKIAIETNTTEGYTDFLKMYPNNAKRDFILSKIHKIEYDLAISKNEKSVYKNYLNTYPTSEFCDEVRNNIEKIDYTKTKSSLEIIDFEEFMNAYPNSIYAQEILTIYETLYYNDALNKREISQLNKFKMRYPTSRYIGEINTTICDIAFENVKLINTIDAYKEFVKLYPNSKYDKEAKNKIIELFPIVPKLLLNGKYQYINKNTGIRINKIEYEKVNLFENNQAIVMQYSKYGVIDDNGRTIVPCQYDEVTRCTNPDLYLVKLNNKMNVFNNEGRQLLKADSEIQLSEQNNDFIAFNNLGKEYRYGQHSDFVYRIVKKQLIIYQCPYDAIPEFDDNGLAVVTKGTHFDMDDFDELNTNLSPQNQMVLGVYTIINKYLEEVIPIKFKFIKKVDLTSNLYYFSVDASRSYSDGNEELIDGYLGVMNSSGKVLIQPIYSKLKKLELTKNNTIYFVALRNETEENDFLGNYGVIDLNGNEIIPFEYQEIYSGLNNQLIVNKGGHLRWERMGHFFYYKIISEGKWGVIDFSNSKKIPLFYDKLFKTNKHYCVRKGTMGKYGVVSSENNILIPTLYDGVSTTDVFEQSILVCQGCKLHIIEDDMSQYGVDTYYISKSDFDGGKWGLIDFNGKVILKPFFNDIIITPDTNLLILNTGKIYENGFSFDVKYEGKYGLSNKQGKLILPIKFEQIEVTSELIFAMYNGKYQIYTKTGELILDSKIDAISELENNFISYRIGEKYGILKPDGSELFPPRFWATKNEYLNNISLEGPYFRIEEAGQYFYATDKGEVFREY